VLKALKKYFSDKMKYDGIKTKELFPPDLVGIFSNSKLIINATPVGMHRIRMILLLLSKILSLKARLSSTSFIIPPQTKLLKLASSRGAETISGLKMLVHQAAKSFELWTNEEMPSIRFINLFNCSLATNL